jgi:hypothetical protein
LARETGSPERLAEVLAILDGIRVYPTAGSLSQAVADSTAAMPPAAVTFVAAPYFAADPSAESVGEQVIALDALKLLDAYDRLMRSTGAPASQILALAHAVEGMGHRAAAMTKAAAAFGDLRAAELLSREVAAAAPYANGLTALEKAAQRLFAKLSAGDQRAIIQATLGLAARLDLTLDESERCLAGTDFIGLLFQLLPRFRASVANLTFGYRKATFVGGFDARQRDALALYRKIRPDVRIESLRADVGVHPTAQTAASPFATGGVAPSVMMIRGVNSQTEGMCGTTRACTVVLEYTEVGARSALLSTAGASLLPVTFFGRVAAEPRSSNCRMRLAVAGSGTSGAETLLPIPTDLLDGLDAPAIVAPMAVEGSTCTDEAAAAILNEGYFALLHERAQRSRAVRLGFAASAAERWARAIREPEPAPAPIAIMGSGASFESPKSGAPPSDILTGQRPSVATQSGIEIGGGSTLGRILQALPLVARDLALEAIAGARTAAPWPLVPQDALGEIILVDAGAAEFIELPFDGAPIVCWRPGPVGPVMAACSADLAGRADTQLATSEAAAAACGPDAEVASCGEIIGNGPVDEDGFIDVFAKL